MPRLWSRDADFVHRLYTDVLGAIPDRAGLDYWTGQVSERGAEAVADAFLFHPDSRIETETTPRRLVWDAYNTILERAEGSINPDPGWGFWTRQVESGAVSPAELVVTFATSQEAEAADAFDLWPIIP